MWLYLARADYVVNYMLEIPRVIIIIFMMIKILYYNKFILK